MLINFYFTGVVATFVFAIIWEFAVGHEHNLRNVTLREWCEDIIIALFSWIGFVAGICGLIFYLKTKK